jgi:hypothetical protein
MLHSVALVRTNVSEELSASFIRVKTIGEPGTPDVTSNRLTLRRNIIQEPHRVTSQKMPFFMVTAVKTSNLANALQVPMLLLIVEVAVLLVKQLSEVRSITNQTYLPILFVVNLLLAYDNEICVPFAIKFK